MAFTGATAGWQAGAQANDVTFAHALESSFGVVATGAYQLDRLTGENFRRQKSRSRPSEISAFYESSAAVSTQDAGSGTLSGALSTGTYDDLIAGVMMNDWFTNTFTYSTASGNSANYNIDTATGLPTLYVSATPFTSWPRVGTITISGNTSTPNGTFGYVKNDSVNPGQVLFLYQLVGSPSFSGITAATSLTAGAVITCSALCNGTVFKSFTLREALGGNFFVRPGAFINQAKFSWQQGQFATCSFDAMYASESYVASDPAGSLTAAPTGLVHDTIKGWGGLTVSGVAKTAVQSVDLTIARDGAAQDFAMGSVAAIGMAPGSLLVSGSLTLFFTSRAEYDLFAAETTAPLAFTVKDASSKGYIFFLPGAKLQNPQINATAKNSRIMASFDIEGNPVGTGGTIGIGRF